MKKNKMLKVLAVPMMAGALLFTSTSSIFGVNEGVYAATTTKSQEVNSYGKDIIKIMAEIDKRLEAVNKTQSQENIDALLDYIDNHYKESTVIAGLYGGILGDIHTSLDNVVINIYNVNIAMWDILEAQNYGATEAEIEELEEVLQEAMEELDYVAETYGSKYEEELKSYIENNHVKLDKDVADAWGIKQAEEKPTTPKPTTITYKIKKGDTLYSIAKAHNTTVKEIKELNNMKSDKISAGKTLKIRKNTVTNNQTTTKPSTNNPTTGNSNVKTYTVKKGDTLTKIAKAHGTTVAQIKKSNGLKNDNIKPKQKLKIEKPKTTTTTKPSTNNPNVKIYTVKKNDFLSTIAKAHGTTVAQLKKSNGLKNDTIYVGQKLKIEKPTTTTKPSTSKPTTNANTYTVKKNDTLYSIAKKHNTTVAKLKKLNNLKNNTIAVGKKLKVE